MKTPILDRLKQATRERHRLLEAKLPLLDPQLSHDNYRCLVSKFYGYYAPMESLVLTLPWWDELGLNFNERQKMPSLEQDLIVLGYKPETLAQLPRSQHLPEVKSISQFLGCLYVMEGATLGGQIIAKQLQDNLGITPKTGAAFFNSYGTQTRTHWKAFCTILTDFAEQADSDEIIIASANKTFETLDGWLFPRSLTHTNHL